MDSTLKMLEGVEEELMTRSFLFTDPVSYRDGVGAATKAVRALLTKVSLVKPGLQTPRKELS